MARILAIDYGKKRTGLAVTDPLQIIATGLPTIDTLRLMPFLREYLPREQVERVIIGDPRNLDGTDTDATPLVQHFLQAFRKIFPQIPIETVDERHSSRLAKEAMLEMGLKKSQRREKRRIDEIAATLLLQEYLKSRS
jgi:putative Holliday junction resolvase